MYNIHVHINENRALVAKASNEYYAGIITAGIQKVTGRRVTVSNAWTDKIVYDAEDEGTAHDHKHIAQTIEDCEDERWLEP